MALVKFYPAKAGSPELEIQQQKDQGTKSPKIYYYWCKFITQRHKTVNAVSCLLVGCFMSSCYGLTPVLKKCLRLSIPTIKKNLTGSTLSYNAKNKTVLALDT